MNKTINFSGGNGAENISRDVADKVLKPGFNQLDSIDKSAFAMTIRKSASSFAVAIAVLSGCLASATPAQAAFNIPTTNANPVTGIITPVPSPLCINGSCATEFTAKMLMFEEFGTKNLSSSGSGPFPGPVGDPADPTAVCRNAPDGAALDDFLKQNLNSVPTRKSDKTDEGLAILTPNPWDEKIRTCVGLSDTTPTFADGRPGGEDFAHQRWSEFPAQKYFQSAQAGARVNGGLRDDRQLHEYKTGEFAPGGLYYLDANGDGKAGTEGIQIKIHPNLPTQNPNSVWTFDGTLPPKLLMAKYGEPLILPPLQRAAYRCRGKQRFWQTYYQYPRA